MVSYQYTYLLMGILFLVAWLFLFITKKENRKEMLIISILLGIAGPIVNYIYIQDWWRPITITHTPLGIEDFLFGFALGGIASVIYKHFFKRRLKTKKKHLNENLQEMNIIGIVSSTLSLFLISFFIFRLHSFISSIIAFTVPILWIYFKRPDLIKNSLISGILITILAIPIYFILALEDPFWISKIWLFKPKIFLYITFEEYIWYFLAGAFIGPLYEYWKEGKLVDIKPVRKHKIRNKL